jgi:hypothetical protein
MITRLGGSSGRGSGRRGGPQLERVAAVTAARAIAARAANGAGAGGIAALTRGIVGQGRDRHNRPKDPGEAIFLCPRSRVLCNKGPARPRAGENQQLARSDSMAKSKRKPNAAFMKPMQPDAVLGAVIGDKAMPRTEVTKKIWAYIKRNKLQDTKNKRMINADEKLAAIFKGKKQVNMFEMTKLVNARLS